MLDAFVLYLAKQYMNCCCIRSFVCPGLGHAQAGGSEIHVNNREVVDGCKNMEARSQAGF